MLDVCKHAAAWLDVPWPTTIAETTKSRYEGKTFPLARKRRSSRSQSSWSCSSLHRQERYSRGRVPRLQGDKKLGSAPDAPRLMDCEGQLERGSPAFSHKFPGILSSVPAPAVLSSVPEGPLCPDTDGQHHDSVNRQGGLRPCWLHMLAYRLILWRVVFSLIVTHVLGNLNAGGTCSPGACQCTGNGPCTRRLWNRYGSVTGGPRWICSRQEKMRKA